jgi:peptide/nickel transport system substrate-binding protein
MFGLSLALVVTACSPGPSATDRSGGASEQPIAQTSGPRGTLKIAWATEPETLAPKLASGSGLNEFNWIFSSFLTYYDFNGRVHPMLAREIPTQENGSWVVNPDGTMVTTYRLREDARWHDGVPVTAHDFEFAYRVYLDRDIPVRDRVPESLMSRVEASDDHTVVISWSGLYVNANVLGYQQLDPLPSHLLEEKYRTNKANFVFGDEWTSGYVGTGPFRIERWDPGTGLIARANRDWFLGAPRLDTLDIRFIADSNTIMANLFSGEIDMTTSPAIRGPEAAAGRDQWVSRGEGYLRTWETRLRYLEFQFRDVPNWQRAITDLRVRQALMHAIDRPALLDGVNFGLGSPADVFVAPSEAIFPQVNAAITKYPYDPTRAGALLADSGWRSAQPGGLVTNAGGQTLDIDVWNTAGGNAEREVSILADDWKGIGVNSKLFIIPSARQRDNEFRVSFPATAVSARTISLDNFVFTTDRIPTPETRYQGPNRGSLSDPELDRLYNVELTSLDANERTQAAVAMHKRMSEIVGIGPLYYDVEVILAKNKVKGPVGNYGPQQGSTWNVYEWEVADR